MQPRQREVEDRLREIDGARRRVVAAADREERRAESERAQPQSNRRVTGASDGVSSKLARSISTRFLPAALAR